MEVLAAGGNAVDAAVAAGLAAGVSSVQMCGIGGYGGHLVIALPGGKKVTAIDFNTAAPAAARPEMFPLDEHGSVEGEINTFGWLAAGVPGTLAGLQLALDRYGTRPLRTVMQPALRLARDGFEVSPSFAAATREYRAHLVKDDASARLLLRDGKPLEARHDVPQSRAGRLARDARQAQLGRFLLSRRHRQVRSRVNFRKTVGW